MKRHIILIAIGVAAVIYFFSKNSIHIVSAKGTNPNFVTHDTLSEAINAYMFDLRQDQDEIKKSVEDIGKRLDTIETRLGY